MSIYCMYGHIPNIYTIIDILSMITYFTYMLFVWLDMSYVMR
jgi:hypothetical protein